MKINHIDRVVLIKQALLIRMLLRFIEKLGQALEYVLERFIDC